MKALFRKTPVHRNVFNKKTTITTPAFSYKKKKFRKFNSLRTKNPVIP